MKRHSERQSLMELPAARVSGITAGQRGSPWPTLHPCLMLLLFLAGCAGLWENMSCWPSSEPGQTVEVACPRFLWMLTGRNGNHQPKGRGEAVDGLSAGASARTHEAKETSLGANNEWDDGGGSLLGIGNLLGDGGLILRVQQGGRRQCTGTCLVH